MDIKKEQIEEVVKNKYGKLPEKVKYIGGGSFGRAFKVELDGKQFVVKAFLREGLCEKEAAYNMILREHCPVKIPEVYFVCLKREGAPIDCFGMELIDGHDSFTNFALLFRSRAQKRMFADAVTDALLVLHSNTSPKFGDITEPIYDSWQDYYRPYAQKIMQGAERLRGEGKLKNYIYKAAQIMWSNYDYIFSDEVKEACMIHGDMNVMNIMTKKPFELVGFIDPLYSMYADREYELYQLCNLTGNAFGLYETYKSKYPASPKCDLKCAFYALFQEINCYLMNGKYSTFIMRAVVRNVWRRAKQFGLQAK